MRPVSSAVRAGPGAFCTLRPVPQRQRPPLESLLHRPHASTQCPVPAAHLHKLKVAVGGGLFLQELQQQRQALQLLLGGALQHLAGRHAAEGWVGTR